MLRPAQATSLSAASGRSAALGAHVRPPSEIEPGAYGGRAFCFSYHMLGTSSKADLEGLIFNSLVTSDSIRIWIFTPILRPGTDHARLASSASMRSVASTNFSGSASEPRELSLGLTITLLIITISFCELSPAWSRVCSH